MHSHASCSFIIFSTGNSAAFNSNLVVRDGSPVKLLLTSAFHFVLCCIILTLLDPIKEEFTPIKNCPFIHFLVRLTETEARDLLEIIHARHKKGIYYFLRSTGSASPEAMENITLIYYELKELHKYL
jgi:hypothetical protein